MTTPILTQSRLKELLHYDPETGVFTRKIRMSQNTCAGDVAESKHVQGYMRISIENKSYLLHRLAWLYVHGEFPTHQIDHKNRTKTDNRIDNLRDVTGSNNQKNSPKRKDNTSGVTGVHLRKDTLKWFVSIDHKGRRVFRKSFANKQKAIAVRKALEVMYEFSGSHGK